MPGLFPLRHYRHAVTKLLRGDNHPADRAESGFHKELGDRLRGLDRGQAFYVEQAPVRNRDEPGRGRPACSPSTPGHRYPHFYNISGADGPKPSPAPDDGPLGVNSLKGVSLLGRPIGVSIGGKMGSSGVFDEGFWARA